MQPDADRTGHNVTTELSVGVADLFRILMKIIWSLKLISK